MQLKSRVLGTLAGLVSLLALTGTSFAADRAYTEGPVSVVSSIKILPGMFDAYMSWLQTGWKKSMEAQKAAGIIVGYNVYLTRARTEDDPDLYLVVTYKNMAAFDGLSDRLDPIMEQVMGTRDQANQAMIDRGKMRTQVGSELLREAILK